MSKELCVAELFAFKKCSFFSKKSSVVRLLSHYIEQPLFSNLNLIMSVIRFNLGILGILIALIVYKQLLGSILYNRKGNFEGLDKSIPSRMQNTISTRGGSPKW
jgi:hypothetical protein